MQIDELIRSRRTVHNFTTDKVEDSVVHAALELGLWALNHKRTFPWVYTLVDEARRERLADAAVHLQTLRGEVSDVKAKAIRAGITESSHLLSLGFKASGDPTREREDYATLACSVQIVSIYLWDRGVGSKWSTGGWSKGSEAYGILGLDPGRVHLEGALLIGKPKMVPPAPPRPGLNQFLKSLT